MKPSQAFTLPPNKTKIVATIGPASSSLPILERMIRAGMNVARLNFSHGDHDFHRALVNRIRAAAAKLGKPVAILQDLQGPKIRAQRMEGRRRVGRPVTRVVVGGPGPSGINLPAPGCWRLSLRWSGRADELDLRYVRR